MASDTINTVELGVDFKTRPAIKSLKDLETVVKSIFGKISTKDIQNEIKGTAKEISNSRKELERLEQEYEGMVSGEKMPKHIKDIGKEVLATSKEVGKNITLIENYEKKVNALEDKLASTVLKQEKLVGKRDELAAKYGSPFKRTNSDIKHNGMYYTDITQLDKVRLVEAEIDVLEDRINSLNAEQQSYVDKIDAAKEKIIELRGSVDDLLSTQSDETREYTEELLNNIDVTKEEIDELTAEIQELNHEFKLGDSAAVRMFKNLQKNIKNTKNRFVAMIKRMTFRTLFYRTFGQALRSYIELVGQAIASDDRLASSVAKLRGAFRVNFQLMWTIVKPIAEKIINMITRLLVWLNKLIATLTGQSLDAAKASAEALDAYADSAKGARKETEKTLAAFDELNIIGKTKSSGGTPDLGLSGIEPDYSYLDLLEKRLNDFDVFLSGMALAIGIILTLTGANIPLGLGLIAVGALGMATAIKEGWDEIPKETQETLIKIAAVGGLALVGLGIILTLTGVAVGLGIGMILGGAALIASAVMIDRDGSTILNLINSNIKAVVIAGMLAVVLGFIIALTGHIGLGAALMLLGAAALFTAVATNSKYLQEKIAKYSSEIRVVGMVAVALGLILLFVPGALPLGLGLIIAGAGALAITEYPPDWDSILRTLKQKWAEIVGWYNTAFKPWIQGIGEKIFDPIKDGIRGALNAILEWIESTANSAVDTFNSVFGTNLSKVTLGRLSADFSYSKNGTTTGSSGRSGSFLGDSPSVARGTTVPPSVLSGSTAQQLGNIGNMLEDAVSKVLSGGIVVHNELAFSGTMGQVVRELKPYFVNENIRDGSATTKIVTLGG